jgi:hypothetical protein
MLLKESRYAVSSTGPAIQRSALRFPTEHPLQHCSTPALHDRLFRQGEHKNIARVARSQVGGETVQTRADQRVPGADRDILLARD